MSATTEHPESATTVAGELEAASAVPDHSSQPDAVLAEPIHPTRSRRPLIFGGLLISALAIGAATWLIVTADDGEGVEDAAQAVTIQAVTAEVRDLVEFTELEGTMSFGEPFVIGPRTDGTLTDIVSSGARAERGDVLWAVDDRPTVLFYGSTPMYRPLSSGLEGSDVRMLEENLAALGHTNDGAMSVDEVFDADTTAAVEAWQADLGLDATGIVAMGDVHVEGGPLRIDATSARSGDATRTGTPVLSASLVESTTTLLASAGGLVTETAAPGTVMANGATLYEVDTTPIPIILGEPIDRELGAGVDDGEDIEVLEQVLLELGHDADGELDVDEVWDDATTDALIEWEEALGIEADGVLQLDQFVGVGELGTIATTEVERGDEIVRGTAIATLTEPTRIVATEVAVTDQDQLPLGATVDVEFPTGDIVSGTVTWVASSSQVPVGQPDADPVIPVELTLDTIPASAESFDELDVEVLLVDDIAQGVVTVPASAIVSTGSAFAVEIVDGSTTRFVEVETGMFADGWVEVSGIEAGTAVVVPS